MGSRGKRYEEPKLNMKKVFAVIIAIAVIIMFVAIIKGLLTKEEPTGKVVSKSYFAAYKDNKWGVIDSVGNNVIDPSYAEMITIPDNKTGIFCQYMFLQRLYPQFDSEHLFQSAVRTALHFQRSAGLSSRFYRLYTLTSLSHPKNT